VAAPLPLSSWTGDGAATTGSAFFFPFFPEAGGTTLGEEAVDAAGAEPFLMVGNSTPEMNPMKTAERMKASAANFQFDKTAFFKFSKNPVAVAISAATSLATPAGPVPVAAVEAAVEAAAAAASATTVAVFEAASVTTSAAAAAAVDAVPVTSDIAISGKWLYQGEMILDCGCTDISAFKHLCSWCAKLKKETEQKYRIRQRAKRQR